MILTDLFREDASTNCHVLYIPNKDTIHDITLHIKAVDKDFSDVVACLLSEDHHDLDTCLGQFIQDYKNLLSALRVYNSHIFMFVLSILPIRPGQDLHKHVTLKSQQLKDNFQKKLDMAYFNLYASFSIQGRFYSEFLHHKLNRGEIK